MAKQTSCKEAIANWHAALVEEHAAATAADPNRKLPPPPPQAECKKVSLICQLPPIRKMDNKLNDLVACEHLSLSTNAIEKIQPLAGLKKLRILSLGRNQIKKVEKLDDVSATLEELWISYNMIEKLDGLSALKKLRVLYISNNKIKRFDELLRLKDLPELEELLLLGNPCYDELSKDDRRREVIKRLPKLKKLDGQVIGTEEREKALAAPAEKVEAS